MAIVSSYSVSCGIAAFTRVLKTSIEAASAVEVDVLELNLKLLQSTEHRIRRLADRHIAQLAQRLATYDSVNLQLENGLYGSLPHDIVRRVRRLLAANPRTSVTLHTPRLLPASNADNRTLLRQLAGLRLRNAWRELVANQTQRLLRRMSERLIGMTVARNQRLIVHTLRTQEQILRLFPNARIDVHPLKLIPPDFVADPAQLTRLKAELQLQADDVTIGLFGFISAYKGHHDGLTALEQLPQNFKLLIFGRQHPQTIKANGVCDPYLERLLRDIRIRPGLSERVHFIGELDDISFAHTAAAVDVCWLPYYESGQDGSGIASICFDVNPRVLCSTAFVFDELLRLIPYPNAQRFDIGNHLELASKTCRALQRPPPPRLQGSDYSVASQAALYLRDLV